MEGDVAPGVVGLHALGQQAVEREGLVIAPRHQAFDHKAALGLCCTARPLTISGLRLSKVPSMPYTSRPPFGASGLA